MLEAFNGILCPEDSSCATRALEMKWFQHAEVEKNLLPLSDGIQQDEF